MVYVYKVIRISWNGEKFRAESYHSFKPLEVGKFYLSIGPGMRQVLKLIKTYSI